MAASSQPVQTEVAAGGKVSTGVVVVPRGPTEAVREEGLGAILLTVLIVVGGIILILTWLVLDGKLGQEVLEAITSDSEAGLVLVTIYLIYYIEIGRDRREKAKEQRERQDKERAAAEAAKSDTAKQMKPA